MEIQFHITTFSLIFLSLLPSSLTSQACHPIDHHALLDFKHKITSDPSNLLQSWTPQTDCCKSWDGIACDSTGRVVNVSRSGLDSGDDFIIDTSMSGTLSPSLSNLTFLQLLDLSNLKDLTGRIPPEWRSRVRSSGDGWFSRDNKRKRTAHCHPFVVASGGDCGVFRQPWAAGDDDERQQQIGMNEKEKKNLPW